MKLTLIRGLPGSGKSTAAKNMKEAVHCEADDFFVGPSEYQFDRTKLAAAHAACKQKARAALRAGKDVVVSNTFVTLREMQPYFDMANEYGAHIKVIEMHGKFRSIHNVPESKIEEMKSRWEKLK